MEYNAGGESARERNLGPGPRVGITEHPAAARDGAEGLELKTTRSGKTRTTAALQTQPTAAPPALADEQAVGLVLSGQTHHFEHLIRRHQKPLINFLYRMVGDFELAVDMAQEVFTKAFLALDRYDSRFRFTTWLYRIASNNAIDHLRRQRPQTVSLDHPTSGANGGTIELASNDSSPAQQLEYRETAERLSRAIAALPPSHRQLIVLRHVHHMRYDEIASICRLPLGTVKNRIFRARNQLRRMMDGAGDAVAKEAGK